VRSAVTPALENVALWHERDISHYSVERGIAPDATIHLDFALHRLAGLIEKLIVYPEAMARNLALLGGLHNSGRVLLALTQKGVSREDAYLLVQRHAMAVWQSPPPRAPDALLSRLKRDPVITSMLDEAALSACFDDAPHYAHVDTIFARVFGG
jgi:adenylosuccinate lyase